MIDFNQITTRKGDSGMSSLADGVPQPKDSLVFEVLGDVDELHSALGLLKASLDNPTDKDGIDWLEHCMLRIGGMLAVPPSHPAFSRVDRIEKSDIEKLENRQKELMEGIDMPPLFITFGKSESGARADMSRAVCRRSERHLVHLIREEKAEHLGDAQTFLNRLSDWLFIKARGLDAAE